MRVCHLIDTDTLTRRPATAALLAELLAGDAGGDHVVWSVGRPTPDAPGDWPHLAVAHHVRLAERWPWLGARALSGLGGFDAVCAWSMTASALTGAAAGRARRYMMTADPVDAPSLPRWVVTSQRRRPATAIATGEAAGESLRRQHLCGAGLRVIAPGVDPARIDRSSRRAMRLRLGVGDERTWLVAAMDTPPDAVDALTTMLAVGLAAETGRPIRLLLGPRARGLRRALRVTEATDRPANLIVDADADRPWLAAAAADAALVSGPGIGAAWAMAAGLLVVASTGGDGLTHDRTASVARIGRAGALAQRLCQRYDDPDGSRRLADAARLDAAARFAPARYAAALAAALADRPAADPASPAASAASPAASSPARSAAS